MILILKRRGIWYLLEFQVHRRFKLTWVIIFKERGRQTDGYIVHERMFHGWYCAWTLGFIATALTFVQQWGTPWMKAYWFFSPVIYHLDRPSLITLEQLDNQNWQSIIEASLYFFSHIFAGGYGANPFQAIQGCYQQYQNNPQYQQQVYGWGGCHIGSCSGVASALSIKAKWAVF